MIKNVAIIIGLVALGVLALIKYQNHLKHRMKNEKMADQLYDLETITEFVKNIFNEMLKVNLYEMNLSKDEFEKRVHNKNQLRKALKNCTYGDVNAKNYIKQYIRDILLNQYKINEANIALVIPFEKQKKLTAQEKFDILLYLHKKSYGYKGLIRFIEGYQLDQPKENEDGISYAINIEEIESIYEKSLPLQLTFFDKVEILTQRIYQNYKGYGVVDEIRDMQIDGISGGVSGIPPEFADLMDDQSLNTGELLPSNYDGIWLFFKGKTIHLSFLTFGSERELIRICKNIYRFNKPGQLSESNGYKINEMKDGSRVVVARPPFSESWVFFVRKFDSVKRADLSELIVDPGKEEATELIKWLIKGCRITAITGSQGTGKTTLLMALIKFINPAFTLRIQETAFELNLRKVYPYRNIVTFRETATVTGQEGLDLQKKTDGTVNILGEVASAPLASLMIQTCQVASMFTLFTHHAKTSKHLVSALRNNLLQTKVFSNEKIAEQQVADVINFDIHLEKDIYGHRYIERITEIIPLDMTIPYPKPFQETGTYEVKMNAFMETMTSFFERMTDRQTFETRDLIRFEQGRYEKVGEMSEKSIQAIKAHLEPKDLEYFQTFIHQVCV